MFRKLGFIVTLIALPAVAGCSPGKSVPEKVRTGAEILLDSHLSELEGKRVGLIVNPTSRVGNVHLLDTLIARGVHITALFAPEHGLRGKYGAGEIIKDGVDQATGLPVYSLYGSQKAPTSGMLERVDLLIFDMQDVGARFYTYISTMKYAMEAAAEERKEFWVLDRPNPAGGDYVAGWILEEEYRSFVGMYPIPVAHGMTVAELATMAIGENWLNTDQELNLNVIEMEGWARSMKWPQTGLEWIPPSPNLPDFENAYMYLGSCFFEGTTLSEGRGTGDPFLMLGHPELKFRELNMEALVQEFGLQVDTIHFTPVAIPGKALYPKHKGQINRGVKLSAYTSSGKLIEDPVRVGVRLMKSMMESTPGAEYDEFLFLLAGTQRIVQEENIDWAEDVLAFKTLRSKYLLYE